MKKRNSDDSPTWSARDFKTARLLKGDYPEIVKAFKRLRGRPPVENPRQQITLRLDSALIESIRASGHGYTARVEKVLRDAIAKGKL